MTQEKLLVAVWGLLVESKQSLRFELLWKQLDPNPQAEIWDFVRALPAEEMARLRDYISRQSPSRPAYSTAAIGQANGLSSLNQNPTEETVRHQRLITILQTI